jgi:hypothetical protein
MRFVLRWRLVVRSLVIVALAGLSAGASASDRGEGFAIYPGAVLPIEGLGWFEQAALDPGVVTDAELGQLERAGVRPLAIVDGGRARALVRNDADALTVLQGLERRGFRGYLLDGRDPAARDTVVRLIRVANQHLAKARVFLRGLSSELERHQALLSGYVADGIFTQESSGDDEGTSSPVIRDPRDSARRLADVTDLQRRHHLPIVVVETVPQGQRARAREIARVLASHGFLPYVKVNAGGLGIGPREVIPRRVLALYDSGEEPFPAATFLHRIATVPFEYNGYILEFVDIRKQPLPSGDLTARYAGIVSRFNDEEMPAQGAYQAWLEQQMDSGMRIVFLGRIGFAPTRSLLERMGLVESPRKLRAPLAIAKASHVIGFETHATPLLRELRNWRAVKGEVHLELTDSTGQSVTPVVTGPWGGLALDPYLIDVPVGTDKQRWIIDPFAFIARALDIEPLPVPDPTTENGRRLLFIHIDGDAFASTAEMPGRQFSGEIIRRQFLQRYPFPTTVSVIEGETSATGIFPALSTKLEAIARTIFRLPNVEPASHAYSHPFDWTRASEGKSGRSSDNKDPVHLPIPGYRYSAAREVGGSLRYISQQLAPPDKPARVFLWSGDARPQSDALKEITTGGYFNMNGGAGEYPKDHPTLSMVNSLGREVDGMLQVYSQAQNDNVYTNEWRGPFYGFRRVVDMFRYTEQPRRLKPINIYYHFYSGTKSASIAALHEAYDYAAAQPTLPIYVSEACAKIRDFFSARIARRLDGGWELRGFGSLRTVRIDDQLGFPNFDASVGVVGVSAAPALPGARYVALSGAGSATLQLQAEPPRVPHLVAANAAVLNWSRAERVVDFRLRGHMPIHMTIGGCVAQTSVAAARTRVDAAHATVTLDFAGNDTGQVSLRCQ